MYTAEIPLLVLRTTSVTAGHGPLSCPVLMKYGYPATPGVPSAVTLLLGGRADKMALGGGETLTWHILMSCIMQYVYVVIMLILLHSNSVMLMSTYAERAGRDFGLICLIRM